MSAAEYVVEHIDIAELSACSTDDATCLQEWIQDVGEAAFRRPLREEESSNSLCSFLSVSLRKMQRKIPSCLFFSILHFCTMMV